MSKRDVIMLFPGHGAQYPGMFQDLWAESELAHDYFVKADDIYQDLSGTKLTEQIFSGQNLTSATVMQPAIYVCDSIMSYVLKSYGVVPKIVLGHSLGEFSALMTAGVFSFEEGIYLTYKRALAVEQSTNLGAMISVTFENDTIRHQLYKYIASLTWDFSIRNSPNIEVLSGLNRDKEELKTILLNLGIPFKELAIPFPFHSSFMDKTVTDFDYNIRFENFSMPGIQIYSTILNRFYKQTDFDNGHFSDILAHQLVKKLDFVTAVNKVKDAAPNAIFVESGPKAMLSKLTRMILNQDSTLVFPTDRRHKSKKHLIYEILEAL